MLRLILSFIPFTVCFGWFLVFVWKRHQSDPAKRVLIWFLAVCSVLYFSHGLFFTVGISHLMECIWTLCSLSVYPLYYCYICRLTNAPRGYVYHIYFLLPALIIAVAKYFYPEEGDMVRKALFCIQVILVCYFGIKRLNAFDKKLLEVYADTEGRDTTNIRHLLVAFILCSVCSALANVLGKHYFAQSVWFILLASITFSTLLFTLSYIGYTRQFTAAEFASDSKEEDNSVKVTAPDPLSQKIETLMKENHFYLTKDVKINDVARAVGSCRTYVSNYINQVEGCSFTDYINRLRIQHAQQLLLNNKDEKMLNIISSSGFSSEQSFYRNFRKFTGLTPAEWLNSQKDDISVSEKGTFVRGL